MTHTSPQINAKPIFGKYLTRQQVAAELGKTPRTLNRWHTQRTGPPCIRAGKTPLYPIDGLLDWLASQTAEPGAR